jgi:hypothetical protein
MRQKMNKAINSIYTKTENAFRSPRMTIEKQLYSFWNQYFSNTVNSYTDLIRKKDLKYLYGQG